MNEASQVRQCVIVYAVESSDLSRKSQLLAFAGRLNGDGIDTEIDFYHASPPEGWNVWMEHVLETRRALIICTKTYLNRFSIRDDSGAGGVAYESRIIREKLKAARGKNVDAVPILLDESERQFIPSILKDVTPFNISTEEGYESLYAFLTGREMHSKPPLGKIRALRRAGTNAPGEIVVNPSIDDEAILAEIAVALERLLTGLRRTFIRGRFSLGEWQMLHNDLDGRVRDRGSRALGTRYAPFCKALDYDQFSINYQMGLAREFDDAKERIGLDNRRLKAKIHSHDAYAMQNIATTVQTLAPFLRDFGNDELAGRLEYVATAQREIAERELGRLTD